MAETTVYAARIRAARAHAGIEQGELAARLGISVRTLARAESGERTPDGEERERIAIECGVPALFLELGFAPMERPVGDVERRVLNLEDRLERRFDETLRTWLNRQVHHVGEDGETVGPDNLLVMDAVTHRLLFELRERVAELEQELAGVTQTAGERPPGPGGELGRRLRERETSETDRPRPESDPGADSQRDTGR